MEIIEISCTPYFIDKVRLLFMLRITKKIKTDTKLKI